MFTHISAFTTLFNIGIYDCSIVHSMTEKKEGQFLNVKKRTVAVSKECKWCILICCLNLCKNSAVVNP